MVIKRIVNDSEMEFELTDQELFGAYEEQIHRWDMSYIADNITNHVLLERMTQNLMMQGKDAESYSMANEIAYDMRNYLDEGYDQPDAFEKACDAYFEKLNKQANPYPAILYLSIEKLGEDESGRPCSAGCVINFGNYPKEIPYEQLSESLNKETLVNFLGLSGYLTSEDITAVSKEEYRSRFGDDADFREKDGVAL